MHGGHSLGGGKIQPVRLSEYAQHMWAYFILSCPVSCRWCSVGLSLSSYRILAGYPFTTAWHWCHFDHDGDTASLCQATEMWGRKLSDDSRPTTGNSCRMLFVTAAVSASPDILLMNCLLVLLADFFTILHVPYFLLCVFVFLCCNNLSLNFLCLCCVSAFLLHLSFILTTPIISS